jgi:hypothetical protein
MKIVYLSSAKIPSRTANSIHIMKMCEALAKNGHQVILFAPKYLNLDKIEYTNEFEYYGVEKNFSIKRILYPKIKFGNYAYSLFILLNLVRNKPDLIYSRFLIGSFFSSVLRIPQIFENHHPPNNASRIQRPMFNRLLKFHSFKLFVVITEVLKRIYLENYNQYKNIIYVAPDGADLPKKINRKNLSQIKD